MFFFACVFRGCPAGFFLVLYGLWGPVGARFGRYFQQVCVFLGNGGSFVFDRPYNVLA